ncbi:MAG: hypothetical protein JNL74_15605 [Fibrobacteres bacterium]|nr:hypothetical protein [Fibrobacterota bacterium]
MFTNKEHSFFLLLAVLLCWFGSSFGQTNVSGNYFSSQIWTPAGNPYVVTGDIAIPANVNLTIQAGVEIQNSGNFTITINGNLLANGTSTLPIKLNGGAFMFRKTNLANSHFSYLDATDITVQLANEAEHNQDNYKNTDTLTIRNSNFTSSNLRTKGYATTAALKISDCAISNSNVIGYYPRSEPIFLNKCQIINSYIQSDAYNYGIHFNSCVVSDSRLDVQGCGGNFQINYSTILNSSISTTMSCGGEGLVNMNFSKIINTGIAGVMATNIQNCIFKCKTDQRLNLGNTIISNSSFIGHSDTSGSTGFEANSISLTNSTIVNHSFGADGKFNTISGSNFIYNSRYNVLHRSSNNVSAVGNYWGTTNPTDIANMILDYWEDPVNLGTIDYSGFKTVPNKNCPISPVKNIRKQTATGGITVSWNANPEPDVSGYKIYYGTTDGLIFTNTISVGKVTSYTITGLNVNSPVYVTAFDSLADGTHDMVEGHESWYSDDITPDDISIITTVLKKASCRVPYTDTLKCTSHTTYPTNWSILQAPTGLSIASLTGIITWTPTLLQSGNQTVRVRATNGTSSDTATLMITVLPNEAPSIQIALPSSFQVDSFYTIPLIATDKEKNKIIWTIPNRLTNMIVIDTMLFWTPLSSQIGNHSLRIIASDGELFDTANYNYKVVPRGTSNSEESIASPQILSLNVSPNPFNPTTNLKIAVPANAMKLLTLHIYEATGKLLRSWTIKGTGYHNVQWNGKDAYGNLLPTGMYLAKLHGGATILQSKLLLVK